MADDDGSAGRRRLGVRLMLLALVGAGVAIGAVLPFAVGNTARQRAASESRPAPGVSTAERRGIELGGPFTLTDQDGRRVTDRDFAGKVRLVFFGFTSCPDVCPTALTEITALLEEVGPRAAEVRPLFVSVDPERDTPEVLKAYMRAFDPGIAALTGSPEEVAAVAKSFAVAYRKVPLEGGGYTMDHSASILLLDRAGRFRMTLDLHEDAATRRAKLVRFLDEPAPPA